MIEKIKKNNKKRNLNIAVATIAGFLLSSGMIYGETVRLNDPIIESTDYSESYTDINKTNDEKELILKKGDKDDIVINGQHLNLNHKIQAVVGSTNPYSSIKTEKGNITITAQELTLDSQLLKNNGTIAGIYANGVNEAEKGLISLEVGNIMISVAGNGNTTGIKTEKFGAVNTNSKILNISASDNLNSNVSGSFSAGIYNEGETIIKNDATMNIRADSEKNNAYGIYVVGDDSSKVVIDNGGTLLIDAIGNETGEDAALKTEGGSIAITSKNTTLTTGGNEKNGIGIDAKGGYIEINGGLEIKTNNVHDKNDIAIKTTGASQVNLNHKNELFDIKIKGQLKAEGTSVIGLNLHGENSYLLGGTSVENSATIDLGVANNAVWKNEGDSKVNTLFFTNGIIDMTHESGKQTIEIETIGGDNGRIVMDISPDDSQTDYIKINNGLSDQTHHIETGEKSILSLKDYDFTKDILIGEAAKNVTLKGSYFANIENIYDYNLDLESKEKEGETGKNNWYVTGVEKKEGAAVEGVMDDLSLHHMNAALARMEADTLHKRLGDIHSLKEGAGVWAKVTSGQMESDKNGYFKNDYTMIQAGADKSETTATGTWTTGFAIHRTEGKADFRNGDGKNESTGISLYKSWLGNDSQYLDLVGKFSHLKNEYKSYNVKNEKMEANYHTNAGTLSLEYGKRFAKDNWYVQPHTQMTYTRLEGKNYNTSSNIRVEQKDINSLIGKVGVYAGRDFGKSSHYVLHEFKGDYGATIKGADTSTSKKIKGKDSWVEIGIGGDIKVGKTDSMNVYYEVERTLGGDIKTNWQATIGVRYKF
ncbi:autotransporter outer membrane beta-barrel domain-containing protein [Fusobacterium ulcerans]|uniref:autotransporter outer membrane beta-barrel domain-containing protein n=1 Tax=Fusobacterium ulcerans TaxID=861 RepID=UPI001D0A2B33|nr:autotransporter outer membrane beta-barrel domain-containing protein [Fusobacterium ulcerans]MCB8566360.1 autotransporter outer membrane beta-barrel domain-containing protein [Fusobacterium ulcerans]MCB8650411.1 autotransporter outer membrane beta-barrel domain-containing protein [Fusobacterium ulcerans]